MVAAVRSPGAVVPRHAALSVLHQALARPQPVAPGSANASQGPGTAYQPTAGPPGLGSAPALIHEPGGDIVRQLQHPALPTIERLFRVDPTPAMFSPLTSPARPVIFELGAFNVPAGYAFWLMDYEFAVLRFSGVDAGDFFPAELGRFSGNLGFDVNVDGRRFGDLEYHLDPQPFEPGQPAAHSRASVPAQQFSQFASSSGIGLSLLPVRPNVQGPRGGPFTIIAGENTNVALSCVVFRQLKSPIAGIQGQMSGYLTHTNVSQALLSRLRPQ